MRHAEEGEEGPADAVFLLFTEQDFVEADLHGREVAEPPRLFLLFTEQDFVEATP